jgi:predicted nucleic acid-binding protein
MKIVLDTSVIIAVIANEPCKNKLIALTKGASLISPYSVHWEIGNAFSAMFKQKRITLHQALKAIELYRKIPIIFEDVEPDESLRIASMLNIYAYDAYLIRCALKYDASLISLDKNLIKYAKQMNTEIIEVIL